MMSNRSFRVPLFVVLVTTLLMPIESDAQTVAQLTLAGTNFPTAYDVSAISSPVSPNGSTQTRAFHFVLSGTSQIPTGARIQEVRFVSVSSGTFTPGVIQARMRPLIGPAQNFFQVVGGTVGPAGLPPVEDLLEVYGIDQYAAGGNAVFTSNPFTGQPWTKSDIDTLQVGFLVRWRNNGTVAAVPQLFSMNGFRVEVVYRTGPVPTLTASPATVTRAGLVTFTVIAEPSAVIDSWSFSGAGLTPITRGTGANSTTWSGVVVAPGTASVRVVQNGETFNLSEPVVVTPRNWSWVAVAPTEVPNGTFETLPVPPVPLGRLGAAQLEIGYTFDYDTVADQGPNKGVRYVTAIRNTWSTGVTRFRYQLSPDLMANNSAFYKAQCGNYNAQTGTGFIRGSTLRSNTQEHEFGNVLGHYQQYGAALQVPTDNLGRVAESRTSNTDPTGDDFAAVLKADLDEAGTRVKTAMMFEACNAMLERDTTCTFRGYINYAPYATCR
jgi:hypothetical protein